MKKVFYLSSLLAFCFIVLCTGTVSARPIPVPTDITITSNPNNDTICSGTHATFSVTATDTSLLPLSYMWQVSTDGGTTWTNATDTTIYSGDTTNTLSVLANVLMNGYKYRCRVTDTTGTLASSSGMLTVIGVAPGTISGPSIVCKTFSITLTDTVSGGTWTSSNPLVASVGSSSGIVTGNLMGSVTVTYTDSNACGMGSTTAVIRVDSVVPALPISGPTITCVGNTINLTNPNTIGTWSWSVSNANAWISHAGVLTGLAHGMDTVYYVFTNACVTRTSAYVVSIDTVLGHGVISGSNNVCVGNTIHLTESVSGGTWFSSSSALAVVDGSGNVTGVGQGIVTISYYLTNACGASIATHIDTVSRSASVITGGDSVGVGASHTLADSVVGGTWTSGDTTIATIGDSSGVVTGVAVGTTTITYTVTNLCGTSTSVMTLYVGNPPSAGTITGAVTVCIGSTIPLSDAVAGGIWSSSNDTFATINSIGVVTGVSVDSGTASTAVTITYTVHNGFGTTTATMVVTVLHTPIISVMGPSNPSIGQNYFIRGMPSGGTWHHRNDAIGMILTTFDSTSIGVPYATFASYIMYQCGRDTLHYIVTNECGTADSIFIMKNTLGVAPVNNPGFALNLYPNPNQGEFTMNLVANVTEQAVVTITNIVGEKVKELAISTNKLVDVKLDQPAGIYLLSAVTPSGTYSAKISIAK